MNHKLYLIEYTKNGKDCTYQIPANSKYDALVRLGQIHGDDKPGRPDVEIEVKSITTNGYNW